MTDHADLRRLAEQAIAEDVTMDSPAEAHAAFHAAATPQAILDLLDERDAYAQWIEKADAAERRVAALEEAGKALLAHQDDSGDPSQVCPVCLVLLDSRDHEDGTCVVRALLDPAAPRTDKPEDWMGGMKDMEIVGRLPEAEVSEASDDA